MNTLVATKPSLPFLIAPLVTEPEGVATYRECRTAAAAVQALIGQLKAGFAPLTPPSTPPPKQHVGEKLPVRKWMAQQTNAINASGWLGLLAIPLGAMAAIIAGTEGHPNVAWLAGITAVALPVASFAAFKWRVSVAKPWNEAAELEAKLATMTERYEQLGHALATERWDRANSEARRMAHGDSIDVQQLGALTRLKHDQTSPEAANVVAVALGAFAHETMTTHPHDVSAAGKALLDEWMQSRHMRLEGSAMLASYAQDMMGRELTDNDARSLAFYVSRLPPDSIATVKRALLDELFDGQVHYRFKGAHVYAEAVRLVLDTPGELVG